MQALATLLTLILIAAAVVIIVRTFDRALRQSRTVPRPTPYRDPPPSPATVAAKAVTEQAAASRRTLRQDIAEYERRHEKGGIAD